MKQLQAHTVLEWRAAAKDFLLIDVRELWERQQFSIGGLHMPANEVLSRKSEIPGTIPVVFYCEKGIRSQLIIQRLEALGYANLYNLYGGMKAWREEIRTGKN